MVHWRGRFSGILFLQSHRVLNSHHQPDRKIRLYAVDSFGRGVPDWLDRMASSHVSLVKHDVRHAPPPSISDAEFVVHAASIASPPFYRAHPIETIDANVLASVISSITAERPTSKPFFSSRPARFTAIRQPTRYPRRKASAAWFPALGLALAMMSQSAWVKHCAWYSLSNTVSL